MRSAGIAFACLGTTNLSFTRDSDGEIDWHLDPVHGKRAPSIRGSRFLFLISQW
jgi:hypothetical protein